MARVIGFLKKFNDNHDIQLAYISKANSQNNTSFEDSIAKIKAGTFRPTTDKLKDQIRL